MRSLTVSAVLLAVVFASAGCTGDAEPAAPAPSPAEPVQPTEGPASDPVAYPGGLTVRLVKVERLDRGLGVDVPADRTIVRTTVAFTNNANQPVPISEHNRYITIYAGPSRVEGEQVTGYDDPNPAKRLRSKDGTRIPAGATTQIVRSWTVPTADLGELAVQVEAPQIPDSPTTTLPYTFAGAERLLR